MTITTLQQADNASILDRADRRPSLAEVVVAIPVQTAFHQEATFKVRAVILHEEVILLEVTNEATTKARVVHRLRDGKATAGAVVRRVL